MSNEEPQQSVQLNTGTDARIAQRDFIECSADVIYRYESCIPDSIKVFLATTPAAKLDELAIDNERFFIYRFGFDARPHIRAQVVALKNEHGLTDHQIQWLRRAGQMIITRSEAKIQPDRIVPVLGWMHLMILGLIGVASLASLPAAHLPLWLEMLSACGVASLLAALTWLVCKAHLTPWFWLRQIGVLK